MTAAPTSPAAIGDRRPAQSAPTEADRAGGPTCPATVPTATTAGHLPGASGPADPAPRPATWRAIRAVRAIVHNGVAEAVHGRVHLILGFFALALAFFLNVTRQADGAFRDQLAIDAGLSLVRLFGMILVVFTALPLFPREHGRRTLAAMLTMSLSRATVVIALYLVALAVLSLIFAAMTIVLVAVLAGCGLPVTGSMMRCLLLIYGELAVLAAVAVTCSIGTSFFVGLLLTGFCYVLGNLTFSVHLFFDAADQGPVLWLVSALYYALPNFGLFDLKDLAVGHDGIPWDYTLTAGVYASALVVVILAIGIRLAERLEVEG